MLQILHFTRLGCSTSVLALELSIPSLEGRHTSSDDGLELQVSVLCCQAGDSNDCDAVEVRIHFVDGLQFQPHTEFASRQLMAA